MHNSVPVENCSCLMSAPSIGPASVSAHCCCNVHCSIHNDLGIPMWSKVELLHSLFVPLSVPLGRKCECAQVGASSGTQCRASIRAATTFVSFDSVPC
jgi:hypothetical protein